MAGSGSEYLLVGDADCLAGFTVWGPQFRGIAMARMKWLGNDFTRGGSSVGLDLTAADGARVPSRVYFARRSFAGGTRAARISMVN